LLGDELDERNIATVTNTRTLIWDIQDLDNPVHTGDYIGPSTSIDHNQYIVGNYSYQANYRSGLRILDINDISNGNLSEAGFFDIYPSSDSANFNGAWGVFPFFASGNVIVSGIEQGLYILRPNLVVAGEPPVVNILNPVDGAPEALSAVVQIQIDATDAEDADGTLMVEWNVDGGTWQAAIYSAPDYVADWDTASVLDGAHVINARAVDSELREGSDSSNVTVVNGASEFTVDSVNVTITTGKGNRNTGHVTLMVSDEAGTPLGGVALEGSFTGGWSGTRNATTAVGSGEASFNTPRVKNLAFIQFCVGLASKAGWSFDIGNSTICGDSDGGGSVFSIVAGQVTDAVFGEGISYAAVTTDSGQSDNSDSFGKYYIANVPVGNRNVSVTASGYEGQNSAVTVSDNATTMVDFALTESIAGGAGSIKGTVYSDSGKLSGVRVEVHGDSSSDTNKGGKYSIQNVAAGWQTVTASKTGYLSQQQLVDVNAGGSVTLNFTLASQ